MSRALNLQNQYHTATLNQLEALEAEFNKLRSQAVADLQALKNGDVSLNDLVVTDDGWEFLPPAPEGWTASGPTFTASNLEAAG